MTPFHKVGAGPRRPRRRRIFFRSQQPQPLLQPQPPPHPQSRMRMIIIQRQPLLFPQNMENTLSPCHICAPAAHGVPAGR